MGLMIIHPTSQDKKKASWVSHTCLKVWRKFGEQVIGMQSHKTLRPIDSDKISVEGQKLFWSRIGLLFYLVKH